METITIKQSTFDAMFEALGICDPMQSFKLRDGNNEKGCEFCKSYKICHIISDDELTKI